MAGMTIELSEYVINAIADAVVKKMQEPRTDTRNCKDCKYSKDGRMAGTEECHECMWESKYEPKTDEDCISRAFLIDRLLEKVKTQRSTIEIVDKLIPLIKELPSVTPQKPRIKALGEELRSVRDSIKGDRTLVGYNIALGICNKYLFSREQEPKTDYKAFAEWVAKEIFDENWEYNKDSFAEIACRKLEKLGLAKADGDNWILEQEPKTDKLYRWLNYMRLGIAPDETTPQDERAKRIAQVEVIDGIMEWLITESEDEE